MSFTAPKIAIVGEPVAAAGESYLRGYNTFHDRATGAIVAATCGCVELVERVVSVRGVAPRYVGEIGDVVVGRIAETSGNRWRCDIGGHTLATILLANVTDPGAMLRRRGREDELTMRTLFAEGDLVAAEVQRVAHDGGVGLHTRSAAKYGRLSGPGYVVAVCPSLVRRVPRQFHTFRPFGVAMVLGVNGRIWLAPATPAQIAEADAEAAAAGGARGSDDDDDGGGNEGDDDRGLETGGNGVAGAAAALDPQRVLPFLARVRNVIVVLDRARLPISPKTIAVAVRATVARGVAPADIAALASARTVVADAVGGPAAAGAHARRVAAAAALAAPAARLLADDTTRPLKRARDDAPSTTLEGGSGDADSAAE